MSEVTTRLKEVQNRIEAARMRSPYHQDVTLVAVTKFHPVSEMKEVIAQGVTQVGENRVQEMEDVAGTNYLESAGSSAEEQGEEGSGYGGPHSLR